MNENTYKKEQTGFTLVEILVVAAISVIFMGAVFGFYRMGGKMFTSGTWRQNTQKKAETFFAILNNRIARTSGPVYIKNSGIPELEVGHFGYKKGTISSANVDVLLFPVCVASKAKAGGGKDAGVIAYHKLSTAKSENNSEGVIDLVFQATKNQPTTGFTFFASIPTSGSWSNNSNDFIKYNLQEKTWRLNDVKSVTTTVSGRVIHISIKLGQPNNEKVTLDLSTTSLIGENISIDELS